jgi:hypothetical protein
MFNYFAVTSRPAGVVWTAPYIDALGPGLMVFFFSFLRFSLNAFISYFPFVQVTATKPVFDMTTTPPRLLGVAGVDAVLSSVESLIRNRLWGTAYGFLVSNDGDAVIHPNLRPGSMCLSWFFYFCFYLPSRCGLISVLSRVLQRN